MNKILLLIVTITTIACSPKIRSKIINKQEKLSGNEHLVVLGLGDGQEIDGVKIGTISSTDSGFSSNCSYYEIIDSLKKLARQNGANIMQITKHKKADNWSTCERINATIYKVDNCKIYEREIIWTEDRKLTWEDFKGRIPENKVDTRFAAETYSQLEYQSNRVTLLKNSKFFVTNTFVCDYSWYKPEQANNDILKHEQGHFDLAEIYARILKTKLNNQKMNIGNLEETANSIFKVVSDELYNKQQDYDRQTEHGINKEKQKEWDSYIALQLNINQ